MSETHDLCRKKWPDGKCKSTHSVSVKWKKVINEISYTLWIYLPRYTYGTFIQQIEQVSRSTTTLCFLSCINTVIKCAKKVYLMPKSPKEKILPRWLEYSNTRSCANITRKIKNLCFHNTTNFRVGKWGRSIQSRWEGAWRNAERIQNPELHTSIHEDDKQTSRTIFYPLSDTSRASTTMCLRVTLGKIIWISLMSSSKK